MNDEIKHEKQEKLKQIIGQLHDGKSVKDVKKEFSKLIKNVSAEEISDMENSLITGGVSAEEVQRLCDVHVEVFKQSLKKQKKQNKLPGHPAHTYIEENKEAKKRAKKFYSIVKKNFTRETGPQHTGII